MQKKNNNQQLNIGNMRLRRHRNSLWSHQPNELCCRCNNVLSFSCSSSLSRTFLFAYLDNKACATLWICQELKKKRKKKIFRNYFFIFFLKHSFEWCSFFSNAVSCVSIFFLFDKLLLAYLAVKRSILKKNCSFFWTRCVFTKQ